MNCNRGCKGGQVLVPTNVESKPTPLDESDIYCFLEFAVLYYIEAFKILNFQCKQSQRFRGSFGRRAIFHGKMGGCTLRKKVQKLSLRQF